MTHLIKLAALFAAGALLAGGCAGAPKTGTAPQGAATGRYEAWTTGQLQSKRTQLLRESAKPDLKIDPATGASTSSWQTDKLAARDLNEIDAELLRRDPSGKLLGSPGM